MRYPDHTPRVSDIFDSMPQDPEHGFPTNAPLAIGIVGEVAEYLNARADSTELLEIAQGLFEMEDTVLNGGEDMRISGQGLYRHEGERLIRVLTCDIIGKAEGLAMTISPSYDDCLELQPMFSKRQQTPCLVFSHCRLDDRIANKYHSIPGRIIVPLNSSGLMVEKIVLAEGLN